MSKEYLVASRAYKRYHYSVLSKEMLNYLHERTLEMLRAIVLVFEKHGIHYMICGGTLLGAVTTGRFIPWDDDVDICVLEDDYDNMKRQLLKELPSSMVVQCKETEGAYYHGWIKVRDRCSRVYPGEDSYKYNGVWVDIYKLAQVRTGEVQYRISREHLDYLTRRYVAGGISFREFIKRIFFNKLIQKNVKKKLKSFFCKGRDFKYIIWSASKVLINPEWVFPETKCMFEGLSLSTFNNPKAYLERHYGAGYMSIPEDSMRCVGIYRIEFLERN